MFFVLVKKFKINISLNDERLLFLLSINLIPILFIFLTSFTMGVKIRTMWMTPFYISFGLMFVYIFKAQINFEKTRAFVSIFFILFLISPISYFYISITQTDKRTDYQGAYFAYLVEDYLNDNKLGKVLLVEGNEWEGGNLCYHLKSRPKCIIFPNSDETLLFIKIDNYTALGFNSIIKEQLEKVTKKQSND